MSNNPRKAVQYGFSTSGRVKRLPMNPQGRDFIVGDIHGAYDLVLKGMKEVGFDPRCDRLFSVGDLVDRGPESWRAAKFLGQPYVHAVSGNHDMNFATLFAQGMPDKELLRVLSTMFSMQWVQDTDPALCLEIARKLAALPIVMEVETARGLVGILHGDVPPLMDWQTFVNAIEEGHDPVIATALEGRNRIESNFQQGIPGVDRVFVGHTPQRGGPQRYGNVYAIDTGAIFNVLANKEHYGLTFANLTCHSTALVDAGKPNASPLMAIPDAEEGRPFSDFVQRTTS